MVHFLASWCPQCSYEIPHLVGLRRAIGMERLGIVLVAIDDSQDDASAFARRWRLPFPLVNDSLGDAKRAFAVSGLPLTVLLRRSGEPVLLPDTRTGQRTSRLEGPYAWDALGTIALLERALGVTE